MTHIARLRASLLDKAKNFAPDLAPDLLQNLVLIGCLIIQKQTLNLNFLKDAVGPMLGNRGAKPDAHYRRLTRFFHHPLAKGKVWKWLISWLVAYIKNFDGRSCSQYLTIDGTSWQLGQYHIHLLVLCLVYRGVSLPLYWINLGRPGHSFQHERIRLLEQANRLFPLKGFCLLGDREFEGREWFKYLSDNHIDFIIRLPKGHYMAEITAGGKVYAKLLHRALRGRCVSQKLVLNGHVYQFVALRHQDGADSKDPLVLLLTSLSWNRRIVAERYRIRWTTECFFKQLKSNGFDLESMGFRKTEKIRLLVAIVVVVYVICAVEGLRHFNRIRAKKSQPGEPVKLRESVFRRGYSVVSNELVNLAHFLDWLLTRLDKPLKVPKRLIFLRVQH